MQDSLQPLSRFGVAKNTPGKFIAAQLAVGPEGEDVDPVRAASRGGRLSDEAAAQGLPGVPVPAVPVAVTKLAVVVDGEDLTLSAIAPRRDGRARSERAAERDPVGYLIRPCFLS